ncbi:hypothetical protein C8R44DRAFT_879475 [Mycena epipterygia]|nr:hypothetical protein C8R44DRAFT_879475 [Mycena epipterygia]
MLKHVPLLRSLILDSGDLLKALTLPHLRRLQYTILQDHHITTLLSFLSRSPCGLRHLVLFVKCEIEGDSLLDCLRKCPSVEEFRTYQYEGAGTLYNYLQSPTVLPQLRTLFVSENQSRYMHTPVIAMLHARQSDPTVEPLSSFELRLTGRRSSFADYPVPSGIDQEQIARLTGAGLRMRVHASDIEWSVGEWRDDPPEFPLCSPA